ncbi:hypothetical protein RGQ30_12930 [Limnobacter thiooxidans]|uniref:Uncharacterized protein n=1 Tax=Limnobacter thiooxidans TaxID=131080 RepID=A0AA86JJV3_9BURK|nr:hypothetical protein RGQ30_12930 [Limnobacter thiooxidans]
MKFLAWTHCAGNAVKSASRQRTVLWRTLTMDMEEYWTGQPEDIDKNGVYASLVDPMSVSFSV